MNPFTDILPPDFPEFFQVYLLAYFGLVLTGPVAFLFGWYVRPGG